MGASVFLPCSLSSPPFHHPLPPRSPGADVRGDLHPAPRPNLSERLGEAALLGIGPLAGPGPGPRPWPWPWPGPAGLSGPAGLPGRLLGGGGHGGAVRCGAVRGGGGGGGGGGGLNLRRRSCGVPEKKCHGCGCETARGCDG